jgi:hypothetical protein
MLQWLSTTDESPQTGCNKFAHIEFRRNSVVGLYLLGSIPWDFMTLIAAGLRRNWMSSFAASIDLELALSCSRRMP